MKEHGAFIGITIVALILVGATLFISGYETSKYKAHKEAIAANVAYYKVDEKTGETKFTYKQIKE
jgi:hypothetical protein